jgi:hypothetical protein
MYYSDPAAETASPLMAAKGYHDAGLNIVPLRTDGTRQPKLCWKDKEFPWWQLQHYYGPGNPSGIGIVCGTTSGNLEVLDFDHCGLFPLWETALGRPALLRRLPVVATPSGGRHVYYRCREIEGNLILARDGQGIILIETRGQGGMIIAPGSPPGTHPSGKPYRLLQGDLLDLPAIDPAERRLLLDTAAGFNVYARPERGTTPKPAKANRELLRKLGIDLPLRPGDDFNERADWRRDILEPLGWTLLATRGDTGYWRKPEGHGPEHHATTNHAGRDLLHVFSTSINGLDAGSYTKFAAYAVLRWDGDFGRAARELAGLGYGGDSDKDHL